MLHAKSYQQLLTKAGSCRWSPISWTFWTDATDKTATRVGSMTSHASSTIMAKGSAARRAANRLAAPTIVPPIMTAAFSTRPLA